VAIINKLSNEPVLSFVFIQPDKPS